MFNIYRRIIIGRRLACEVRTQFNLAGKLAAVGDGNILCEHHLRTQRTPVRRRDPYLQLELLKIVRILRKFQKFEYVDDP